MSVYTLYALEKYKYGSSFIKSKNKDNPFVIHVNKDKKYIVYDTREKPNPDALSITFFGYSVMTEPLSKIDYAKSVVRKLYKRMLNEYTLDRR